MDKATIEKKIDRREEITRKFKQLLIDRLRLDTELEEIPEDAPLFGHGLGLDSVDTLEIVVGIEQEFGLEISEDDRQIFRSVNTVVDYVLEHTDE